MLYINGESIPGSVKNKSKPVFVSINNIAREFLDIDCPEVRL